MTNALKDGFPLFVDEQSLRSAIESVCAEFGRVTHLNILPPGRGQEKLQCICFVRLDSAAAEAALSSTLRVTKVDDGLAFFADVHEHWTGPIF